MVLRRSRLQEVCIWEREENSEPKPCDYYTELKLHGHVVPVLFRIPFFFFQDEIIDPCTERDKPNWKRQSILEPNTMTRESRKK